VLLHCRESLALAQQLGARSVVAQDLTNMGAAYQGLGQLREAEDCYDKSLKLKQKIRDLTSGSRG
jgi:hypothetical protein